jgi:uncharacterized membrane protein
MTYFAILLALTLVVHFMIGSITIAGTNINVVLIPISLCAMVLGPVHGAALGFIYGAIVLIQGGVMSMDPFTSILFQNAPFMTALICVSKTTAAGFLCGTVYRLLEKKNRVAAVLVGAAITPITNTGIFIVLCLLISKVFTENAANLGFDAAGTSLIFYLVVICAGWNFVWEFVANMILSPVLTRVINVISKRKI